MKKNLLLFFLFISLKGYTQVTLIKTINLDYPVARIIHFPSCGDNPFILCKKNDETHIVINDGIKFEINKNENLLFADHFFLYTSNYTNDEIVLRKYAESGSTYKVLKEVRMPRMVDEAHYYLDIEMTDDHLFYFAHQPNTSSKPKPAKIDFYNSDLNKAFTVQEDFSIYNIHCFGLDSILFLKEYIYEKTLSTHLYNHEGKLLKEESFELQFKPNTHSTVSDFLNNDGVIFTIEQTDTARTHVIKFSHFGKMMWDEVLNDHYYGFTEFNDFLIAYGGGNFTNPDYKLLFINEQKGTIDQQVDLRMHFEDFLYHKGLQKENNSFIPFGFNVNPEHTWISFIMSIYTVNGKNTDADRILIFHGHHKVQILDINLTGSEHPKVVPTDKNHLIVGIGNKVFVYKVE